MPKQHDGSLAVLSGTDGVAEVMRTCTTGAMDSRRAVDGARSGRMMIGISAGNDYLLINE